MARTIVKQIWTEFEDGVQRDDLWSYHLNHSDLMKFIRDNEHRLTYYRVIKQPTLIDIDEEKYNEIAKTDCGMFD